MPSVESRKANFYYAHPRNRFWQMLSSCYGQPTAQTVEEKINLVLTNNLALWDVLAACDISASDDSSIRNPVYNDIAALLNDNAITKILCNGKKAYSLCCHLNLRVPPLYMPSTSPANASFSLERLIETWLLELKPRKK